MPEEQQNQNPVLAAILSLSVQITAVDTKIAAIDKGLAVNTLETTNVKEQLTKLNGKVATHEAALGTLQTAIALFVQAKTDKEKDTSNWQAKLLDKIVWLGLGLLAIVIYTLLIRTHTIAPLSTLTSPNVQTPTTTQTK